MIVWYVAFDGCRNYVEDRKKAEARAKELGRKGYRAIAFKAEIEEFTKQSAARFLNGEAKELWRESILEVRPK